MTIELNCGNRIHKLYLSKTSAELLYIGFWRDGTIDRQSVRQTPPHYYNSSDVLIH